MDKKTVSKIGITALVAIILIIAITCCYFFVPMSHIVQQEAQTTESTSNSTVPEQPAETHSQQANIPVLFSSFVPAANTAAGQNIVEIDVGDLYAVGNIQQNLSTSAATAETWSNPVQATVQGLPLLYDFDFDALQSQLRDFVTEQNSRGFAVQEFSVLYINSDLVDQLIYNQEETFMGYRLSDLLNMVGENEYLTFDEDGSLHVEVEFDSATFWANIVKGIGIILIGSLLAPLSGGVSFGVALAVSTATAVGVGVVASGVTLLKETIVGLNEGRSFKDSIENAGRAALNSFGHGFVAGAIIGTSLVNVVSGLNGASATSCLFHCFAAGTMVATADGPVPIENLSVGDYVLGVTANGDIAEAKVLQTKTGISNANVDIILMNGEVIHTTYNHAFYTIEDGWIVAGELSSENHLVDETGKHVAIKRVEYSENSTQIVYNIDVEGDFNSYFVGSAGVLVHNGVSCAGLAASELLKVGTSAAAIVGGAIIWTASTLAVQLGSVSVVKPQTDTIVKTEHTAKGQRVEDVPLSENRIFYVAYVGLQNELVITSTKLTYVEAVAALYLSGLINTAFNFVFDMNSNLINKVKDLLDTARNNGEINETKNGEKFIIGIYTKTQAQAQALALAIGAEIEPPEIHFYSNLVAYWHYHDRNHKLHIWFNNIVTKGEFDLW